MARRPGFAARVFTDGERDSPAVGPRAVERLAARFAAKEADDEGARRRARRLRAARRRGAWSTTRGRRRSQLHGAASERAERLGVGSLAVSLSHTSTLASAVVVAEARLVRPVLTAAEMRAADEAAAAHRRARGPRRARRARGRDRRRPAPAPRLRRARRGPVRPGLQRRRRPRGGAPPRRAGRGRLGARRRRAAAAARRRRPRRRRRVRDRALASLRPAGGRPRRAGARRRRALGRRPRHGRRGRCRAARDAHRRDGCDQAGAPARRRRAPERRVEVAPIGIEVADPACALVEDGDLDVDPTARPRRAQVAARRRRRGGLARHARRARARLRRRARASRPGWCCSACPTCPRRREGPWPSEVVRLTASAQDAEKVVVDALERARALVIGPGLGRSAAAPAHGRTTCSARPASPSCSTPTRLHLVDADLLAARQQRGGSPLVLTPHDGEYAALFGAPPGTDRVRRRGAGRGEDGLHGAAEGPDDRRGLATPPPRAARGARGDLGDPRPRDARLGRRARRGDRRAARPRRAAPTWPPRSARTCTGAPARRSGARAVRRAARRRSPRCSPRAPQARD